MSVSRLPEPGRPVDPIEELRDEVHLLKQIVRKANAILTDDDTYEQVQKRYAGLRAEYTAARASYFTRFGRSL